MLTTTTEALVAVCGSAFLFWIALLVWDSYWKTPPGPVTSPWLVLNKNFVNLFRIRNLTDFATHMAQTYGPLVYANFLTHKILIVSDRETQAQICKNKNLQGRPLVSCLEVRGVKGQYVGISGNEGRHWGEVRGFAVRSMKELGIGKPAVEESLVSAARDLAQHLKERNSTPVDPCKIFCLALTMTFLRLLTSLDYRLEDPDLREFYDAVVGPDTTFFKEKKLALYNCIHHGLALRFSNLCGLEDIKVGFARCHDYLQKIIDEHQISRDKQNPRDMIDLWLTRMEEEGGDPQSAFYGQLGFTNLKSMTVDLLGGNTEMVTMVLAQCFLYLGHYPEVKAKVVKEVQEVIGPIRAPRWDDRLDMPYTEAFLSELLRRSSLLHAGVERLAVANTQINGYCIPKDTVIFQWIYGINHNPKHWGPDVHKFDPERFLIRSPDQQGVSFNKDKKIATFGSGPRSCPGEFLGRQTLFLFLTTLLQQLDFKFDPSKPPPSLVPDEGHVLSPKEFHLIFTAKQEG